MVQSTSAMTGEGRDLHSVYRRGAGVGCRDERPVILDFLDAVDSEEIEIRTDTRTGRWNLTYQAMRVPLHRHADEGLRRPNVHH